MGLTDKLTFHNGIGIPQVGLGVYKVSNEEVYDNVLSALQLGYRHIDTASFYENEEGVGKAIRDSGIPREELFITSKVWNDEQGFTNALEAFYRSLNKLGLDYLDLYLVHWPVPDLYKDTWRALEKIYEEKKVRAIGVSNFLSHHLDDLLRTANEKPVINQVELHPRLSQEEVRLYCKKNDILVEAWAPLGKGQYLDDPVLQEIAAKHGKTPAQVILRWELQSGIVIIPKSSRQERQKENADIFDFSLTDEEMERIDGMNANERLGIHPDEFDY